MEYGHSWTNLRDRARNIYIYIYIYLRRRDRERNWVILNESIIEEKRICRCMMGKVCAI